MFGMRKTLDIITLFSKAGSPASARVVTLLKQVSANSSAPATADQASDHSAARRSEEFDLDITENHPTADQVKTILEYVGQSKISTIVKGAQNESDALRKFGQDPGSFQRPVVVDWSNGKAIASENESEILKMLNALHKK
ncbi:thioredoxin-like protein [Plectosphaerella plurivora]|uniref:Thioredoxin-like protein n=1 Tax=Plectosphaerella plurivora TaxID=936078 RepID=A0A9P9AGX7_9PEZI|nr:thioredoxin-like protein [Plectosphaerella plurivora]